MCKKETINNTKKKPDRKKQISEKKIVKEVVKSYIKKLKK